MIDTIDIFEAAAQHIKTLNVLKRMTRCDPHYSNMVRESQEDKIHLEQGIWQAKAALCPEYAQGVGWA